MIIICGKCNQIYRKAQIIDQYFFMFINIYSGKSKIDTIYWENAPPLRQPANKRTVHTYFLHQYRREQTLTADSVRGWRKYTLSVVNVVGTSLCDVDQHNILQ